MKKALHSVSYAGYWGQVQLPVERVIEKAAAFGYDGIMLTGKRPHGSLLDMDRRARRRLRKRLESARVELACVAGYNDFSGGWETPDVPLREMQIYYITEWARLASDLGGNLVRIFTAFDRASLSYDQQWNWCVEAIRECCRRAAPLGVKIGVQNHHDLAADYRSMADLLREVAEPNCIAMFDAWSPALHGVDIKEAVRTIAPFIGFTTVADYVRRPRFKYHPPLVNYTRETDVVRAVPMGEGFIDYQGFFAALKEVGYDGWVGYEMCSPLQGGGSEENLDRCAQAFLQWMEENT